MAIKLGTIVEMRAERARVFEQIKALNDRAEAEKRNVTAEEQEFYDKANAEIDEYGLEIAKAEREERLKAIEASLTQSGGPKLPGNRSPEDEFRADFDDFRAGRTRFLPVNYTADLDRAIKRARRGDNVETRDLLTTTAGVSFPVTFIRSLREHEIESSAIRQTNVTVLVTATGEDVRIQKTTAHPAAVLVAEAAAIPESDPTLALVTLNAFKYANLEQLSREFAQDEAVNILEYLARRNGQAIGNGAGAHFVTGTGTGQPRGVQTAAAIGKTGATGQTLTVTTDDLIDLYHSVVTGYRGRGWWMMRDATAASIRKLKDSTGQYLWQPGLQLGQPDLLFGRPVVTDPNMPAMAASTKSILFGDFSSYYIRDVGTVDFERSDEFAFGNDLVTFRAIWRTDGDLVDENGIKAYSNSAT